MANDTHWLDTLPEWHRAEIENERVCMERIKDAAETFAEAVLAYPHAWDFGDGAGGSVMEYVRRALDDRGFTSTPAWMVRDDSKPTRLKMTNRRRMEIFERDGFKCQACGVQKDLSVDHITPVAHGGSDEDENLQTLCKPCNSSKGTKAADEWSAPQR